MASYPDKVGQLWPVVDTITVLYVTDALRVTQPRAVGGLSGRPLGLQSSGKPQW